MVHAALLAAGHRAARYTSPHLIDITERFVVGTEPVDRDTFDRVAADVLDCAERLHAAGTLRAMPTFFEATTAIGFELFRRAGVTVAVIEVGLGGRFDATNVITPVAGAITTIALDHVEHLGTTFEQIAFEKAGIIKPGMPIVTGSLPPTALAVVREVVKEKGAHLIEASDGVRTTVETQDGRARVTIATPTATYGPLALALRGDHQVVNAVTAVRLLEAAAVAGVRMSAEAVQQGLERAQWPARLEVIELGERRRILLDAAHNGEGAAALAAYLRRWHPERPALVIGLMRDKDVDAILRVLLPEVSMVVATAAQIARALPADELARRVAAVSMGRHQIATIADPVEAVGYACELTDTVCVAGSIVLAGAVRNGLEHRLILRQSRSSS
jgi:dihydrofolate synthase/folylpolyglutamate synthase